MAGKSAKQLSSLQNTVNEDRVRTLAAVREQIAQAAAMLQPLGGEYERIAWILEDSLTFIDDAQYTERGDSPSSVHELLKNMPDFS